MSKFLLTLDAQNIAGQIAKLLNDGGQLWAYTHPANIISNNVRYMIELDGETIIGVVGLEQRDDKTTEIKHLCVHPNYRRRGLGRKLLEKAAKAARTEFVYGTVRSDNHTNIRNNMRVGMMPVSQKRGSRGCHIITFARRNNSDNNFGVHS